MKNDRNTLIKLIKEKESELNKLKRELEKLEKINVKGIIKNKTTSKNEVPSIYSNNMVLRKKVIFIINKQKQCTIKDIAEAIIKLEKDKEYDSVYPQVQQAVIKLLSQNQLNKIGDYNSKYELKI